MQWDRCGMGGITKTPVGAALIFKENFRFFFKDSWKRNKNFEVIIINYNSAKKLIRLGYARWEGCLKGCRLV